MSCQLVKEIPVLWLDLYRELSTLVGNVFNNNNSNNNNNKYAV